MAKDDEIVESVIRVIAHDLKNPLAAVRLNAQLIEREAAQAGHAKEARWAALIVAAARRMDTMLGQLVEAERLRAGRIKLALAPLVVGELLREVMAEAGATFAPDRVRLTLPDQPVVVSADRVRLGRALGSLLGLVMREAAGDAWTSVEVEARDGEVRCSIRAPRFSGEDPSGATSAGEAPPVEPGGGLVLHVARTVIECHGGSLRAAADGPLAIGFDLRLPATSART